MSEFSQWAFSFWWNYFGLVWKMKLLRYGVTLCFGKKRNHWWLRAGLWLEALAVLVSVKKQLNKDQSQGDAETIYGFGSKVKVFWKWRVPMWIMVLPETISNKCDLDKSRQMASASSLLKILPTSAAGECAKFHPLSREVYICVLVH